MTLSDLSIKRPVFAWMLMFGLIVFGAVSFQRLGISQLPDVDFPVLSVSVTWEGAAPEVIEAEIVDPLEQAVVSVEGIKDLSASVRQGQANINIEFTLDRNIDAALQEVQAAISRVRLPIEVDQPTVRKSNPEDQPIMWIGVSSTTRSLREIITFVELSIKDQFQILPGVGEVILGGYTERNLRVWVDNNKLKKYELTVLDVRDALQRGHIETAAGTIENESQELNLRFLGEGATPEDVGRVVISTRGGKPIYNASIRISDVARVEDGLADIRRYSRVNGIPGIGVGIRKQRGANAVQIGLDVRKRMTELAESMPKDLSMGVTFDSTLFIKEAVEETEFTLILSSIVTALVCWFFLGSLTPTFNILLSIPTSIIGTFTAMYFLGFTLNLFTILALALAVGIVVDDAIMVLENIYRHRAMGKSRIQASLDGAREITFAAVAATLAVVAIFLPVAFMQGVIGKFFFQFGMTISVAVLLSLLEAITLTPMRCSQMMEKDERENWFVILVNKVFAALARSYRWALNICLKARWLVILTACAVFASSLSLYPKFRKEFIPAQDQSVFLVRIETVVGSSLLHTLSKLSEVEEFVKDRPEVERVFAAAGGFGGGEVNSGIVFVTLVPPLQRALKQGELMQLVREKFAGRKDIRVMIQDLSTRGLTAQRGFPVQLDISGPAWNVLEEKSNEIIAKLEATGLVVDTNTNYKVGQPEVRVSPLRAEAFSRGVPVEVIGETIQAGIGGIRQGKFTNEGRRYDVRLRLEAGERVEPEDLLALNVRNIHGELIPLREVATVEVKPTVQTISRKNRERAITIEANVAPNASQAEALEQGEKIAREILPAGYRVKIGGGAETFRESFDSLNFVLFLGVVIAYMVLASQFNSFLHPFTVLLSLPFSITGAFFALYVTDNSLNLYSMIGIILLMGLVKKNAILLVEFANKKRYEENFSVRDAILEAGPIRLRPILMTTAATLAAALPPALAIGPGAETRIPMAIAVLGGMAVSTFFTLFVVPCVYSILARFEKSQTTN